MSRIGLLRPQSFVWLLNYIGVPATFLYFISMCVVPWFYGDWEYVHQVWLDWQTLNTGVLAFISSITAFNIASFTAEIQRAREFVAARALLPQKLDSLLRYVDSSAEVLQQANFYQKARQAREQTSPPELNTSDLTTIQECIRYATPEVAKYLANILNQLQVHSSRLDWVCRRNDNNQRFYNTLYYELAVLRNNITNLFPLARGEDDKINTACNKGAIDFALHILNIRYEFVDGLEDYVSERLGKISHNKAFKSDS
ncbi:TPA: hypothetical protein P0E27_005103 [Vibrio harveyi]|nr:hypothetical protein [Vibrio harveyi]